MQHQFLSLWKDTCRFCEKNRHEKPSYEFVCSTALKCLQQYPAGMTRSVLLTELESRFRQAVRRGEHSGKLLRVITQNQLEPSEVITGKFLRIDDFRCKIISLDDPNVILHAIIHRQVSDFIRFSMHIQYDLNNSTISFTDARLLKQKPLLLLPAI